MAERGILLDLDGTVWDGWAHYARLLHERGAGDQRSQLAAIRGGASAANLLDRAGVSKRAFAEACTDFPAELYDGIAAALAEAARQGVRLAAVTNLPKWMCEPMIAAHALPLETTVSWTRARRPKPNPDPLLFALEQLGLEASEQHWYVGDSAGDARAAKAAGLRFAWASWGYAAEAPRGTDRELASPEEILGLR